MQYLGNELAKLHDFRPGSVRDERPSECPKACGGALGWGEAHRLQSLASDVACLVRVAHLGVDLCKACQTESPVPVVTGWPVPPGVGKELGRQAWLPEIHGGGTGLHLHVGHRAVDGERRCVVTTGGIQAVIDRLPVALLVAQKGQGSRLLAQGNRS